MTAANAFIIVASIMGASLTIGFILWKFKYVIWKGWVRAIIECEDGDILIRTVRMKKAKSTGEQDQAMWLTVKGVKDRYDILPERIRRMGKFRIPTSVYYAHRSEPIDLKALKIESKISATRNAELAKNTVTSQLLTAFTENPLREAMAIFLGVVIVLGGLLILGYWLNSRLDTIIELVG